MDSSYGKHGTHRGICGITCYIVNGFSPHTKIYKVRPPNHSLEIHPKNITDIQHNFLYGGPKETEHDI